MEKLLTLQEHIACWREETQFISNVSVIIGNEHFKAIVAEGENAVPHIIEVIRQKPDILVWALNAIYKIKISDKPLTIKEACKQWVKKYDKGLLK